MSDGLVQYIALSKKFYDFIIDYYIYSLFILFFKELYNQYVHVV